MSSDVIGPALCAVHQSHQSVSVLNDSTNTQHQNLSMHMQCHSLSACIAVHFQQDCVLHQATAVPYSCMQKRARALVEQLNPLPFVSSAISSALQQHNKPSALHSTTIYYKYMLHAYIAVPLT
jgi:hypothetical protein